MDKESKVKGLLGRLKKIDPVKEQDLVKTIIYRTDIDRVKNLLNQLPDPVVSPLLYRKLKEIPSLEKSSRSDFVFWMAPALVAALALFVIFENSPVQIPFQQIEEGIPADLPEVNIAFSDDGLGQLGGTSKSPVINWDHGRIELEVEPQKGINLIVRTQEANVKVVGTVFSVNRDMDGTEVEVEKGAVAVECKAGQSHLLHAGESCKCELVTAPGQLFRATKLRAQGAKPEQILSAIEVGLSSTVEGDLVWSNLQVLRMVTLNDMSRTETALELAQDYLDLGYELRREEVLRFIIRENLNSNGCSEALPYMQDLISYSSHGAEDIGLYVDCIAEINAKEAKKVLESAILRFPDQAEALRSRYERL